MKVFHRVVIYEDVDKEEKLKARTAVLLEKLKEYGVSEYALTVSPEPVPQEEPKRVQ
jgi:hypothetical protein